MKTLLGFRRSIWSFLRALVPVWLLALLFCAPSSAQASAEFSGTTAAVSGTAASQPKPSGWTTPASSVQDPSKPQNVAAATAPPPEVVNRQTLEQHAGKNACKLLLRSVPSAAQVYVDGAFVGNSPMLLIIAPGKYQIEMRGHRLELAERVVDLLPRETREVALSLTARYPTRVTTH